MVEQNYVIILLIAILILILYTINFSGKSQIKSQVKPEKFGNCNQQPSQIVQLNQSTKVTHEIPNGVASLNVHIAHWCGWSKKLLAMLDSDDFKSKYDANNLKSICVVNVIDCEANKEKCDPSFVKGFPTIILHTKSGKMLRYDGNRSADDLINFMKTNS